MWPAPPSTPGSPPVRPLEAKEVIGKDEDGNYKIGAKLGADPALGGAVGFEFTVDPDKVADAAGEAANSVGDAAGSVKDTASNLF